MKSIRTLYIFGAAIIIALIFDGAACSQPGPEDILKLCGFRHFYNDTTRISSNEVKIIIDNSISMAGFSENAGMSVFSRFIQELSSGSPAGYKRNFYKFIGNNMLPVANNDIWPASIKDDYYDQPETKLGDIAGSICNTRQENLPAAFIIVTDGITSTKGYGSDSGISDYTKLIREVKRWQEERGFPFTVIGVRSPFSGEAYSETNRLTGLGDYDIGQYHSFADSDTSLRPFYILIFASSGSIARELTSLLQGSQSICNFCQVLNFQPKLVEYTDYSFEIPLRIGHEKKNPIRLLTEPNDKYPQVYNIVWQPREGNVGANGELISHINFSFTKDSESCMNRLSNVKIKSEVFYSPLQTFQPKPAQSDINLTSSMSKQYPNRRDLDTLNIEIELNPGDKNGWYIYHETIYPDPNAISPPQWVTDWSTDSDNVLSRYNRTYNLMPVVQGILVNKPILEQQLGEFFIVLKKGQ